MPVPKQIKNYLDKKGAKYAIVTHKKVYTAYDVAQTLKKKLDEIVKNLLVKTNKGFILVLLPASKRVDLNKLKKLLNAKGMGVKKVEIPKEGAMVRIFKVKPGALGAFGSVHELEVYMDKNLQKVKKAIFPTGSFTDSVEMAMKEFEKLEKPIVGMFSEAKKFSARGGSAFGGKKKVVKVAKKIVKKIKKVIKKRK
ncbi:MAG: YbaK/EbsC family protein [Candidatus Parcubacteria bacterium]|nr:YbaK/EbsC family protein [Candidatus Parcubacteria bacterium]